MHYYEWFMQKHIKIIIIIARKFAEIYRLCIHQFKSLILTFVQDPYCEHTYSLLPVNAILIVDVCE